MNKKIYFILLCNYTKYNFFVYKIIFRTDPFKTSLLLDLIKPMVISCRSEWIIHLLVKEIFNIILLHNKFLNNQYQVNTFILRVHIVVQSNFFLFCTLEYKGGELFNQTYSNHIRMVEIWRCSKDSHEKLSNKHMNKKKHIQYNYTVV